MSHKTLAEKFVAGAYTGKAGNTFIEGGCLYSYGRHFVIAERKPNNVFYITTRKYSQSTTRQTSIVRRVLEASGAMVIEKAL